MNKIYWTVWTGLRGDNNEWIWQFTGKRSGAANAKALARKTAKNHAIQLDFSDGRAVAYTYKGESPDHISTICNRNGTFYQLQEVWP